MFRLHTFGGLALDSGDGGGAPRVRAQRLAILAVIASAGARGVSRERLAGLFWSDNDEERARHSLRQALYALRQELGADLIRSGTVLTLDASTISADVSDFRTALAAGEGPRAARLANGPFLEGFYLPGASEFERWVEDERGRLSTELARIVLGLAKEADTTHNLEASSEWWRQLTTIDPLSGRYALGYLKSLAARGDRAGALAFARSHEQLVRRELESDADPEIRQFELEMRRLSSPDPRSVVAPAPSSRPRTPDSTPAEPAPDDAPAFESIGATVLGPRRRRTLTIAAAVMMVAAVALAWRVAASWLGADSADPESRTFAVGLIREEGVPDSLRIGGVLTDMLATNLARVEGLSVLANTRLIELMRPGQDTVSAGYSEVARRAGAHEILQGRLLSGPSWGLALELQRVDLRTGLVKGGYRVSASDRYALIDSMTATIARDLRLGSPRSSVSEATTTSPIAYRLYEEGLRAYYQYDSPAAGRLMDAALREDSTFAMAAYYSAIITPAGAATTSHRARALRLASRAPTRERLIITANILRDDLDPRATDVADSLARAYPSDPRTFFTLASSLVMSGRWKEAVAAVERAIVLDSTAATVEQPTCALCDDFALLAEVYFWWDSLPAAERAARRLQRALPRSHLPWVILYRAAVKAGNASMAQEAFRQVTELAPTSPHVYDRTRRDLMFDNFEQVERDIRPMLTAIRPELRNDAPFTLSIALRNQGRLAEALRLARGGRPHADVSDPYAGDIIEAVASMESGDPGTAASIFLRRMRLDMSGWSPGIQARHLAWQGTLAGTALAAAGDTAAVARLADSVETWGRRSSYGRDRVAHHFLRGLLLVARGNDEAATEAFRRSMFSPSVGYTRVNYELGRTLLRLNRPAEAVPVLQSALRGESDGPNLYVTRTELHELLAEAFVRLSVRDSAATHYRAVVKAWSRADVPLQRRRNTAVAWLAGYERAGGRRAGSSMAEATMRPSSRPRAELERPDTRR